MEDEVTFKRKLGFKGASLAITIPPELLDFVNGKDQDTFCFQAKKGKHGKYLAIWVEKSGDGVIDEQTTRIHTED